MYVCMFVCLLEFTRCVPCVRHAKELPVFHPGVYVCMYVCMHVCLFKFTRCAPRVRRAKELPVFHPGVCVSVRVYVCIYL